jgi:hypothetical protein
LPYLNDDGKSWHPHVMFFVSGDAEKSWGANLPGSPVIAASDAEQRLTTFMVLAGTWSDGTPAPSTKLLTSKSIRSCQGRDISREVGIAREQGIVRVRTISGTERVSRS